MPTNKITLKTVEDFMNDYTPIYQPMYPLFMGKSQAYAPEVGKLEFRRLNAVGDLRTKHITPKDTEIRQFNVMEGKKAYKKYFLANQFTVSTLQDSEGVEGVVTQVLDEHQVFQDELFLMGEGTGMGDTINNGLFFSDDINYLLESSYQIPSSGRLAAFYAKIMTEVQKASLVAGRKVLFFYGSDIIALVNGLMPNSDRPFRVILQEALAPFNCSVAFVPEQVTGLGSQGFMIANMDQVKLHYTVLPQLWDRGVNNEKLYAWNNFLQGSMMLEILVKNAVIRQPLTLE